MYSQSVDYKLVVKLNLQRSKLISFRALDVLSCLRRENWETFHYLDEFQFYEYFLKIIAFFILQAL